MAVETVSAEAAPARQSRFVNNHLANERTFLAYLRTAVSLMSFGIAINRFSFFLVESKGSLGSQHILTDLVHSAQVGIGMVVIGMGLLGWAAWRYTKVCRQIEREEFYPQPGHVLILTALVLAGALIGLVWLFMR
jgi:putative membrane protein